MQFPANTPLSTQVVREKKRNPIEREMGSPVVAISSNCVGGGTRRKGGKEELGEKGGDTERSVRAPDL